MRFSNDQLKAWAKDCADSAATWHTLAHGRINGCRKPSAEEIEAYRIGILEGYGRAVSDLSMHGAITVTFAKGGAV